MNGMHKTAKILFVHLKYIISNNKSEINHLLKQETRLRVATQYPFKIL